MTVYYLQYINEAHSYTVADPTNQVTSNYEIFTMDQDII